MKTIMALLAAAGLTPAFATETNGPPDDRPAPAPAEARAQIDDSALANVAGLLKQYGLSFDAAAARRAALEAMVRTADPGARLLTDEDVVSYEDRLAGWAFETGIRLRVAQGAPKVSDVTADSPAAAAGLQAGDVLLKIDGGDVSALKDWEIASLLSAPAGSRVAVTFERGGETQQVELAVARLQQPALASTEDLPGGLGLVRLNGLYPGSSKDIIPALRGWDGRDYHGLILDLRGAGGGDLEAAADVAALWADDASLLFSIRDPGDQDIRVYRARPGTRMDAPVMALIDADTTGAAEALAAALADSVGGVMLVGLPTRGDPMVRERLPLPGGGHLLLATRKLVTADGKIYSGHQGVTPDVEVTGPDGDRYDYPPEAQNGARTNAEEQEKLQLRERTRGDPSLRRAVDILLALKALNIRGIRPTPANPR